MKLRHLVAAMLGTAFVAAPLLAQANSIATAPTTGGTVCGRVNATPSYIFQLQQSITHDNVIVARSQSEEVQAPVNIDGTYCFTKLHADLHTIVAFEDAFPTYKATVTPIDGQTIIVDLTGTSADL